MINFPPSEKTQTEEERSMRVAIVQYDPQIGQVQRNLKHVTHMIETLSKDDGINILMLSEMAFTGYVFQSKDDVQKVAERAGEGPTFEWCQSQAKRLNAMVMCGYVEVDPSSDKLYNAMMVLSPSGELVCNPRKHFLYETDKPWATPGDSFTTYYCPWLDKTISFGICMDINPNNFEAAFDAYEFGTHAAQQASDLVLFSCAWCDFEPPDVETYPTLSYWAQRLSPIIEALRAGSYPKPNCYFLCSNRIGSENGTFFVGASCAMSLKEPGLLVHAGRREEIVLTVDIP